MTTFLRTITAAMMAGAMIVPACAEQPFRDGSWVHSIKEYGETISFDCEAVSTGGRLHIDIPTQAGGGISFNQEGKPSETYPHYHYWINRRLLTDAFGVEKSYATLEMLTWTEPSSPSFQDFSGNLGNGRLLSDLVIGRGGDGHYGLSHGGYYWHCVATTPTSLPVE